ncbi:hypothetical protein WJX81_008664 [Elliptochloris bilobata]|uniref:Proteasome inhibitor PI31 subunit n=1 Tax=Elliptochloris bilobata TaxID=381761 RepID=A0AAW1RDN5_9CHLO
MSTPQTLLAIIRAAHPQLRNKHDAVVFAVHAFMLADGYKLVATGKAADEASEAPPDDAPEVAADGWNDEIPDSYAFLYADDTGKRSPTLLKALPLGNKLVVSWLALGRPSQPQVLELDETRYLADDTSSAPAPDAAKAYKNLDELLAQLRGSFYTGPSGNSAPAEPRAAKDALAEADKPNGTHGLGEEAARPPQPPPEPEYDEYDDGLVLRPRRPQYPPVGGGDVELPGMRPPGAPDLPGMGGPLGGSGLPGVSGGGMHVGPDDPLFAGRMGFGRGRKGDRGRLPPGARWDPVGPPGMQGFHPDDFRRGGPGGRSVHPDIMPPGPGASNDFDSMYG